MLIHVGCFRGTTVPVRLLCSSVITALLKEVKQMLGWGIHNVIEGAKLEMVEESWAQTATQTSSLEQDPD